jgi:site-specific DNA-methyltransferase (adenine-specific)
MGSGSTAGAAIRSERFYVGFDTDPEYVERARARVAEERGHLAGGGDDPLRVTVPAVSSRQDREGEDRAGALRRGRRAQDLALLALEDSGFRQIETGVVLRDLGLEVTFRAIDAGGKVWLFELSGAFSTSRPGLKRPETLWRALGKASVVAAGRRGGRSRKDLGPLVLLSTDLPGRGTPGARALEAVTSPTEGPVFDVIELLDPAGLERLRSYGGAGPRSGGDLPGY